MGGSGSGWRGAKTATVEDGLTLSLSALIRRQALVPGRLTSGTWGWSWPGVPQPFAWIGYRADLTSAENAWLRLDYRANNEPVTCTIRLETTLPTYGGHRWWFRCPATGRRAAKLHLPPGGKLFACRQAYGLTYRSCQESGKFRRLFESLGAELGMSPKEVGQSLKKRL